MHHPTDRIAHTTAFITPVMEHWLEQKIHNENMTAATQMSQPLNWQCMIQVMNTWHQPPRSHNLWTDNVWYRWWNHDISHPDITTSELTMYDTGDEHMTSATQTSQPLNWQCMIQVMNTWQGCGPVQCNKCQQVANNARKWRKPRVDATYSSLQVLYTNRVELAPLHTTDSPRLRNTSVGLTIRTHRAPSPCV